MAFDFDFEQLQELLCEAAHAAFAGSLRKHQKEQFYAFALYTTGLFDWIYPACNTEEGLRRVAKEYQRRKPGSDLERQALELRWSPEDWAYQDEGKKHFAGVNRMLRGMGQRLCDLSDKEFDKAIKKLTDCALSALRQIDNEVVFGDPIVRANYVLNLMMDDQDNDSIVATARKINPPKMVKKLKADLQALEED